MDIDQAKSIVTTQHRAVLTTLRADRTPQMSPVLVTPDAAGRITISTTADTAKVRNLHREPRAWLCVLPDEFFGRWIQIEGDVEIVPLPEALPLLEEYYRGISGEHEDWDSYRTAMRAQNRVLIRVELTGAGPR